jgi:putative ABC transport system permease protein
MAIGASPLDVQRMILRQAVVLGAVGTAAGLALSTIAIPLLARVVVSPGLEDATPRALDPAAGGIAIILMAVVILAAWVPARRASRIEPTLALRTPGT